MKCPKLIAFAALLLAFTTVDAGAQTFPTDVTFDGCRFDFPTIQYSGGQEVTDFSLQNLAGGGPLAPAGDTFLNLTAISSGHLSPGGIDLGGYPVSMLVLARFNHQTGPDFFFDTEMLALNLTVVWPPPPPMIRESPTLQSLGQLTMTDIGGGQFRVSSFFDVFTELSTGGVTWFPQTNGPSRIDLNCIPEPSSACLFLATLPALGLLRRNRARRERAPRT